MQHSWRIVVGDWSRDGHNESEFIRFKSTHDRKDIIKGYKKAHSDADGGICSDSPDDMLSSYGDSTLSSESLEKLAKIGLTTEVLVESGNFEGDEGDALYLCEGPQSVAYLFLEMTRYGLAKLGEEFEYEIIDDKIIDCINGFWQSDFNHGMGYGVLGNY